jgi:adenylosuccinate lyase
MSLTPTSALSPLDGRYAAKLAPLRPLMSEQGYMHRRVQVEVAWLIALSDAGFAEFKPLSPGARTYLLGLVKHFSEADAQAIKDIEKTTNHDVKAVEYWLKRQFEGQPELQAAGEFVHFACTSEDINNTSHALMLKAAREQVLLPASTAWSPSCAAWPTPLPQCRCSAAPTARPPARPPWARRSPTWWRAWQTARARIAAVKPS